ncbi:MAG: hypothetical protein AAGA48_35810 [Myxococcota bacterium]
MTLDSPLVFVDGNRQVMVADSKGVHPQLGGSDLLWATWGQRQPAFVHSWSAWGPDQRRIASFRIAKTGQDSRVWVTDVAGVSGAEVGSMGSRVPIYLQWSPSGQRLAVLSQDDQELVLAEADPTGRMADRELLRGSPLFFTWLPGDRLAAFVGEGVPTHPRMAILSPDGQRRDLPGAPGNFCAPVVIDGGLAYVAHHHNQVVILASTPDGHHVRELELVDGLVALLAAPHGPWLARAISPDGTGAPYRQLDLLNLQTAEIQPVTDAPSIAFFWLPQGNGFVIANRVSDQAVVHWSRVDLQGHATPLIDLVPSRDSRVYLRFFEQYSPSHPVVDPTGRNLVLCGSPADEPDAPSRVWLVPLDGGPPEEIGEGLFASFAPHSPRSPDGRSRDPVVVA